MVAGAFMAAFTTAGAQAYAAGAFLVPMSDELGWTRAEFLIGQTTGQFFMAFAGFFVGGYVDRFGARPLMFVGATLMAVSLFAVAEINELWQWVLVRGVFSMLGAALLGFLVVNVTISKWFVEQRGRAIGLAAIGVSFAGVVLPPLLTWYVDEFGWRSAWRALAVGVLLLGYPAAAIMRRTPEDHGLHPDGKSDRQMASGEGARAIADFANSFTRAQAIRTRALYFLVVTFGLSSLGMITMIVLTIPYLTDSGFSRGTAALMVSVLAVPAAVSKPLWGYMGDRWSERWSTSLSFVMNAGAMLIIIAATRADSIGLLVVGYLVIGWGIGGQIPLQETIWASYFGRRYIGAVRSTAMPFTMLIAAAGPILVAAYFDRYGDYDRAMYGIAGAWATAAWIILLARRPLHPSLAGPPVEEGAPA
jgi:MFS family permease